MHLVKLVCAAVLLIACASAGAQEVVNGKPVTTLEWDQLMPADFNLDSVFAKTEQFGSLDDFDPKAQQLLDEMMMTLQSAPVVQELDGKMVRIPGFVVPLEGNGQTVSTFFLVPYFGACIHVPPPPSNQIVHVDYEPGTKLDNLYDAVWVTGLLKISTTVHDLGTAGYSLEAYRIEPYQEEGTP